MTQVRVSRRERAGRGFKVVRTGWRDTARRSPADQTWQARGHQATRLVGPTRCPSAGASTVGPPLRWAAHSQAQGCASQCGASQRTCRSYARWRGEGLVT